MKDQIVNISSFVGHVVSAWLLSSASVVCKQPQIICKRATVAVFQCNFIKIRSRLDFAWLGVLGGRCCTSTETHIRVIMKYLFFEARLYLEVSSNTPLTSLCSQAHSFDWGTVSSDLLGIMSPSIEQNEWPGWNGHRPSHIVKLTMMTSGVTGTTCPTTLPFKGRPRP